MNIGEWANIATFVGVLLAIVGLILAYRSLKKQNNIIKGQLVEIKNKIQFKGIELHNVIINGEAFKDVRIMQVYQQSVKKMNSNE